jgi:hypothetical protein
VSFDEIFYLMKRYSPKYFMRLMQQYADNDPRPNIKRYFELYHAKLQLESGKQKEAKTSLENLLGTVLLDTAHEKLFLGRLYESLAVIYDKDKQTDRKESFLNTLYEQFPQLIPFSQVKAGIHLQVSGIDDAVTKKVIDELKNCNIDWVTEMNSNTPVATVNIQKKGIKYYVTINVVSGGSKRVVSNEKFLFMQPAGAGKEIAMRIFGSGGAVELENVQPAVKQ